MKIALLGAESTGKSRLCGELAAHLRAKGASVAVVPEVLREWCQREGRTPRPEEQMPIAQEQESRVDAAAATSEVVISDTTALMVAIYSAMLFEDGRLYQFALARQRSYSLTLLTGLDVPWVADGLQRDGPQVREPVDAMIRTALSRAGIGYQVVYGSGPERLDNALAAIASAATIPRAAAGLERCRSRQWSCEKCSDPDCEHRLFRALLAR
jgi:nicotinamide riboside kinase